METSSDHNKMDRLGIQIKELSKRIEDIDRDTYNPYRHPTPINRNESILIQ